MSEDTPADATAETTSVETTEDNLSCQCCDPVKPLVPKMDMGQTNDGKAKIAICIYHQPEKSVYVLNEASGRYELREDLKVEGAQIIDTATDEPFGRTSAPPNLMDLGADDEASIDERPEKPTDTTPDTGDDRPATGSTRTNLEDDGFYGV